MTFLTESSHRKQCLLHAHGVTYSNDPGLLRPALQLSWDRSCTDFTDQNTYEGPVTQSRWILRQRSWPPAASSELGHLVKALVVMREFFSLHGGMARRSDDVQRTIQSPGGSTDAKRARVSGCHGIVESLLLALVPAATGLGVYFRAVCNCLHSEVGNKVKRVLWEAAC